MRLLPTIAIAPVAVLSTVLTGSLPNAHAGGYLAVGMGADAALGGELRSHFDTQEMDIGRIALGHRVGPVALEAVLFGVDLRGTSNQILGRSDSDEFSSTSAGVDLKYYIGLSGALEGYVRGGVNKTWLTSGSGMSTDVQYVGRGYSVGGGVQYTVSLASTIGAALWLDYNRHMLRLDDSSGSSIAGNADMITIGVSVGTGL